MRIELHWRFFRETKPRNGPSSDGFNRSDPDSGLPCLKGAPSFAYVVMHGAQHGFYAAQWLVDVVVQCALFGEVERDEARFLSRSTPWKRNSALQVDWPTKFWDWIRKTNVGQRPGVPPSSLSPSQGALAKHQILSLESTPSGICETFDFNSRWLVTGPNAGRSFSSL